MAKDLSMFSVAAFPAPLRDISNAPLPHAYEAARAALAECEKIDECKTWADKAAAMASYARQSKDDSLLVMAKRIHARAVRRCGEILQQIPRADEATRYGWVGEGPPADSTSYEKPVGRTKVADEAGLSERQRKTALRVAAVPAPAFESQVESPRPPSVTQFAHQGTAGAVRRDSERPSVTRVEYETSTVLKVFKRFVRFCGQNEPTRLARCCSLEDAAQLRQYIAMVDRWLERCVRNLPECEIGLAAAREDRFHGAPR
jgi:hypothetical protein